MMIVYVLQMALPLVLILWLAVLPPRSRAGFWMLALAAAVMIFAAAKLGIWVFLPWWVPYLLRLMLVGSVSWRLLQSQQRPWLPTGIVGWLSLVIFVGVAGFAAMQSRMALTAARMPEGPAVSLAWPLGPGLYLVANGGTDSAINAHASVLDQSVPAHAPYQGIGYAVDLIAMDRWGLRADGVMPADPARYAIFGTSVLAPCAGTVVAAKGTRPDMDVPEVDEGYLAGNYVILRCGDMDVLLAHFRRGSLRVAVGDYLGVGQQIADVGNSGESSEPHLHIHAQMPGTPDAPFAAAPVAMRLDGRFLVRGDRVDASSLTP